MILAQFGDSITFRRFNTEADAVAEAKADGYKTIIVYDEGDYLSEINHCPFNVEEIEEELSEHTSVYYSPDNSAESSLIDTGKLEAYLLAALKAYIAEHHSERAAAINERTIEVI